MQSDILEYLPPVFSEIREMIVHAKAQKPELESLWMASDNAYNDQFLDTMTENGIKRWEAILNIQPSGNDMLEDRRFRIVNKLRAKLPYTYRMLEMHLNQLCGSEGYIMSYNPVTWTLYIRVSLTRKKQFNDVHELLKEMLPANIILDYDLQYNSYAALVGYTHVRLRQYKHEELRMLLTDEQKEREKVEWIQL